MAIQTTNPATGEVLKTFDALSPDEIEVRLTRAVDAFAICRAARFEERAGWLRAAADLLDAERDDIAVTMTTEMGKTRKAAAAEAAKCATGLRFYAEHAEAFLADEPLDDPSEVGASQAYARYQPLGVVLAVMPWNFPLWQVIRFAAPALMAGNVGLLKHASNVPQSALYLEDLFRRAGVPEGGFQTLLIGAGAVEAILRDPRVAAATVTGSEPAGRSVASICGDEVKPTVLELGGSDAYVVLPSADIEQAAKVAVTARCQNNGQSCIAAKRFIVHTDVFDAFAEHFVAGFEALKVGDPLEDGIDIGPIATEQGRADLIELVGDAVAHGATVRCGGKVVDGPGWFYEPTVITDITPAMRLHLEETFGPVATLYRVADIDEAIELANVTSFGLSSNAWTTDPAEQSRLIADLEAGGVFINGMTTSYPQLPFGGIKRSGYGRELAAMGIREFCNAKTVWVG
jgi:succinate-semialdehyde dehydrogenase/glutarate-semialdehyde dehydrogenase